MCIQMFTIPATCQMVYHFIEALGREDLVDQNVQNVFIQEL